MLFSVLQFLISIWLDSQSLEPWEQAVLYILDSRQHSLTQGAESAWLSIGKGIDLIWSQMRSSLLHTHTLVLFLQHASFCHPKNPTKTETRNVLSPPPTPLFPGEFLEFKDFHKRAKWIDGWLCFSSHMLNIFLLLDTIFLAVRIENTPPLSLLSENFENFLSVSRNCNMLINAMHTIRDFWATNSKMLSSDENLGIFSDGHRWRGSLLLFLNLFIYLFILAKTHNTLELSFLNQRLNPRSLHWQHGIWTTRKPAKSPFCSLI